MFNHFNLFSSCSDDRGNEVNSSGKNVSVAAPCGVFQVPTACFFGVQAGGDEAAPAVVALTAAAEHGHPRPSFAAVALFISATNFEAAAARLCVSDTFKPCCRRLLLATECALTAKLACTRSVMASQHRLTQPPFVSSVT